MSQKNIAMLSHFLSMLVIPQESCVLDLTCGSGSALVAALQLKARRVLGLEIDPEMARVAEHQVRDTIRLAHPGAGEPQAVERSPSMQSQKPYELRA